MAGRLQDKVILISGGARGLGASHARVLVSEGANVVIGDLLDADGTDLANELGATASYVHLDVTDATSWSTAIGHATSAFGGLDVLVNNAGIANAAPIADFPIDLWSKTLEINLTGTFLGIRAAVPALALRTTSSIINISSVEGLRGSAGLHAYVASKFGVRGLTKSVALEVAHLGIRVNSIHPGLVETPMTKNIDPSSLQIPLGRSAQPIEVSRLVMYLASDESSYSTGAEFVIDGGLTVGIPHQ
jgi:3alpha(or 20beta)-hydroxysteroid dehydrogenase